MHLRLKFRKISHSLWLAISILIIAGCSNEKIDNLQEVESYCKQSIRENDAFCECVARSANETLNDQQIAFMAAGFRKDQQKITELRKKIPMNELLAVGVFMASSVTKCSDEG